MTTATQPAPVQVPGELTIAAPDGAEFVFENVKTDKGARDLGPQPILVWRDLQKAIAYYGEAGVIGVLDGTSLRVSFQGTARRMAAAGKSHNDIATEQIKFRPGTRVVGAATPESRAARAARKASEAVGAEGADAITKLLEDIAAGRISAADIQSLVQS